MPDKKEESKKPEKQKGNVQNLEESKNKPRPEPTPDPAQTTRNVEDEPKEKRVG